MLTAQSVFWYFIYILLGSGMPYKGPLMLDPLNSSLEIVILN